MQNEILLIVIICKGWVCSLAGRRSFLRPTHMMPRCRRKPQPEKVAEKLHQIRHLTSDEGLRASEMTPQHVNNDFGVAGCTANNPASNNVDSCRDAVVFYDGM